MSDRLIIQFDIGENLQAFIDKHLNTRTEKTINKILEIVKEIRAMNQETIRLLGEIDAASTELATDIQALLDRAEEAGSLTAEEINTALAPKVEFLKALASNTNAPIPEVPPPTEV